MGRPQEALALLVRALEIAHTDLHRFTFIEAAEALLPLLQSLAQRSAAGAWTHDVLAYCLRYRGDSDKEPAAGASPLVEPLSERELEIVALLAEGLTNKQIGERLHLSPNTVRVHTSNIYGKLAVNGRVQAVAAAQALKLI